MENKLNIWSSDKLILTIITTAGYRKLHLAKLGSINMQVLKLPAINLST